MRKILDFLREFGTLCFTVTAGLASLAGLAIAIREEILWLIYFLAVVFALSCVAFSFIQFQMRRILKQQLQKLSSDNDHLREWISLDPLKRLEDLHSALTSAVATDLYKQLAQRLDKIRRLILFSDAQDPYPLKPVELTYRDGNLYLSSKCTAASADQIKEGDMFFWKETINGIEQKIAGLVVHQAVNEKGLLVLRLTVPYNAETIDALKHMVSRADWTASKLGDYVVTLADELPDWEIAAIDNAIEIVTATILSSPKEKDREDS